MVTETGSVVVAKTNPVEWIVAIEYREMEAVVMDSAAGPQQLIPIGP